MEQRKEGVQPGKGKVEVYSQTHYTLLAMQSSLQGGRSLEQTLTLYRKLGQKQGVGTILRVGAVFVLPYQTTHQSKGSVAQDKQIKAPNGKKISKVFI